MAVGAHAARRGEPLGRSVAAHIRSVSTRPCVGGSATRCVSARVTVRGAPSTVDLGPVASAPTLGPGTTITVSRVELAAGVARPPGYQPWQFVDVDRHGSLIWLAVAFVLLSLVVIRWRGLLAALGVALSLALVVGFLVPAILDGRPALTVALVTALAAMFVTLTLTNGFGPQMLAAALGIGEMLIVTCLVALFAVHLAHIDGRTNDLSAYIGSLSPRISLQGIVLAGMVVGALGVLADTAVTQASAVMALAARIPR